MRIEDAKRVSGLATSIEQLSLVHGILGRKGIIVTLMVPTGSFDGISGKNHYVEVRLGGLASLDVRNIIRREFERVAFELEKLGVTRPELK